VADDVRRVLGEAVGTPDILCQRGALRILELERPLIVEQRGRLVLGLDHGLTCPRGRHLLAELDRLEGRQLLINFRQPPRGGDASRDDRPADLAWVIDCMLQDQERPVGVAKRRVAIAHAEAGRKVANVFCHPGQGPCLLRGGPIGAATGSLVREHQPVPPVARQRIQVVREHGVVKPRAAVEHEQRKRSWVATLVHEQPCVTDLD